MDLERFRLPYGRSLSFELTVEPEQLVASLRPPAGLDDVPASVAAAVASPLNFPPLDQSLVPGDQVTIVLDRDTPAADQLLLGLWRTLERIDIAPASVKIVQPADLRGTRPRDPRTALPAEVGTEMTWHCHDPLDAQACGDLAAAPAGGLISLRVVVVDADVVLCLGGMSFDETLGFRGTLSPLYPGLSNADAIRRSIGGGHAELQPENPRSLRELADEVGWLLGVQFVLQVVPAERGGVAAVLAGSADAVFAAGRQQLIDRWQIDVTRRAELVVATVDADAGGHGWRQVAAALDAARRLVARDGRILLLTELSEQPSEGIELMRDARSPREALRPIRERAQVDRREALQLAQALDRANIYLLSQLPDDLVEDLFMVPVATPREAGRVVEGAGQVAVVGSAQHAFVREAGEDR